MSASVDVLYVSGQPVWPPTDGGRIRAAGLTRALARHLTVRVLAPVDAPPPDGVAVDALPPADRPPRLSWEPRLGRAFLGPDRAAVLHEAVAEHRPRTVLFASGYLAAMAPSVDAAVAVDAIDVEVLRMASLARCGPWRSRAVHGVESLKARWWEPRLARRATLVAATAPADVALLRAWGASAVLVPHGADPHDASPSSARGPVTFLASFGYLPNRDAARFLLGSVWPRLRAAAPDLRLRIAGREAGRLASPGIEVVGDPVDVDRLYRDASVVLAPVRRGGGAQVKVAEALARGRVVIASPHCARSAPPGSVLAAGRPDEWAATILDLWRDVDRRHALEDELVRHRPVPTWDEACAPLVAALTREVKAR